MSMLFPPEKEQRFVRFKRAQTRERRQMLGHGVKFGRKKEEAIAALLTHRITEEAARAIGVAPYAIQPSEIPEAA